MSLYIKGVQKTTMIDFPGKLAATIFTGKCNFRCPFCHNPELVLRHEKLPTIPEEEILDFLKERKNWLDGICITGGEPTLHKELIPFIEKVKALGLEVKLDTNGSNPEMVKHLLENKLVDYIAMDIKSDKEHYNAAIGVNFPIQIIEQTINIIRNSNIAYEFRTTVVPTFYNEAIAKNIGEWLKGSKLYILQQYNNEHAMIDEKFLKIFPYPEEKLYKFAELVKPYFKKVEVRV